MRGDGRDRAGKRARRGWRECGPDGHPHLVYRRQSIFPNNYYIYIRDPDWGPTFIKTIAYAPFPTWVYLNGNEWSKQQAAQQDVGFKALDNGFASCEQPTHSPRSATASRPRMCGCSSALAGGAALTVHRRGPPARLRLRPRVPQLEISDTRMFDRPIAGRAWFQQRSTTALPGPPRPGGSDLRPPGHQANPRSVPDLGLRPPRRAAIQIHFRASKVKQYFKEGRALRTDTTIDDTRDFGSNAASPQRTGTR